MYAGFFRSLGHAIELVSDAMRGLEAMAGNRPDLAIADVQGPGLRAAGARPGSRARRVPEKENGPRPVKGAGRSFSDGPKPATTQQS